MKTTVKWLALICIAAMLLSLAACSGSADYGWVKFKMPSGWSVTNTDGKVSIEKDDSPYHHVEISVIASAGTSEDYTAQEVAKNPDFYSRDTAITLGGYTWIPVRCAAIDMVNLYTSLGDGYVGRVSTTVGEKDPDVQSVLKSLSFDTNKL